MNAITNERKFNLENYGIYDKLIKDGYIDINLSYTLLTETDIESHFKWILNILRDGIETDIVKSLRINIIFSDNIDISLSIFDYLFNLLFWNLPVSVGEKISSRYLFFSMDGITKDTIKEYIDNHFIRLYRDKVDIKRMNNIIDDSIYKFTNIDYFGMFLSNTVCFEDTIDLMNNFKEINNIIHADLSNDSVDTVMKSGMDMTKTLVNKIIESEDHCLKDPFLAKEGLNIKQFKEVSVNIGTKPDGTGSIFPYIINNSYINGGVKDLEASLIDSSVGRLAQILSKNNVGKSGDFARILSINNMDTSLNDNIEYSCDSVYGINIFIKDDKWLNAFDMRYYRFKQNGPEYLLNAVSDKHLIGQTLIFRSPMTCQSLSDGRGICKKCYGDLYYINKYINVGILAAQAMSSKYTQKQLSAKHILESSVINLGWTPEFETLFEVIFNNICIIEDFNYDGYYIRIEQQNIQSLDEEFDDIDDDFSYNEYITEFDVICPNDTIVKIHTKNNDPIYISKDMNLKIVSDKSKDDDEYYMIKLSSFSADDILFYIEIQNKELSATLKKSNDIINKSSVTSNFTKDEIITALIENNLDGGISLNSVHYEVILANQIRDIDDILEKPTWSNKNKTNYQIIPLSRALQNNPSITVTLEHQKIAQNLVSPLSHRKTKPSVIDTFFMVQPQNYIDSAREMISDDFVTRDEKDDTVDFRSVLEFYNDEETPEE